MRKKEAHKAKSKKKNCVCDNSISKKDKGKNDISILKLIQYIAIFFIPLMVFVLIALNIGAIFQDYFQATPATTSKIFMFPFMIFIFFFFIPFIRKRENIAGIRFSILAFFIIGTGLTLPSALKGKYSDFLMIPSYFASYVLLTFFFCPEVLGIERNIRDWFKHKKQLSIVFIYTSIVLLYVTGFGGLYYDIYTDPLGHESFSFSTEEEPTIFTFIYYSMVSFTSTGYGEILPVSAAARLVFFLEACMALIMNVLFIAILLVFISNAEFLARQSEESELIEVVKEEEKELKKEEKELKRVEAEVKNVEKRENFMMWFLKKMGFKK